MPTQPKELIHKVNGLNDDKISCVLVDIGMGLALDVAAELGIPTVGLWPAAVLQLAVLLKVPKLIDDGLIDENGAPLMKHKRIQLSPMTPSIHPVAT
ncbi:UDP-glycosyltransferase 82A1-like [Gossypium raimondii]|uniref:UDP-glycosyltransferase 82A1-like n=1 Tax=Gossypium raimondii TaxID=29730 RepID=UPI00227B6B25|nr:UDP-glycosyltransferase 82A1-like [Gossypium raimondii]